MIDTNLVNEANFQNKEISKEYYLASPYSCKHKKTQMQHSNFEQVTGNPVEDAMTKI